MATGNSKISIQKDSFGVTSDSKEPVTIYTLTNSLSGQIEFIDYGATIRSWRVPSKDGRLIDVALGFEKLEQYEKSVAYVGCIVGRVSNRIRDGQFTLDGQTYKLTINSSPHHSHGGKKGFSYRVWKAKEIGSDFLTFEYVSPDGEEGYPSTVRASVTYRFSANSNRLVIEFDAINEGTKTTPVNMTNHAYFNLLGVEKDATIRGHRLQIFADTYVVKDDSNVATGEILPVDGTVYDMRSPTEVGGRIDQLLPKKPGINATYAFEEIKTPKQMAVITCPETNLSMYVSSTQPGLLIYTAQYLNESGGKYGRSYGKHSGICLETQHYPDAVNNPNFPPIWLRPGEKYHQVAIYEFTD